MAKEATVLKIEKTSDKAGAWVKLRVLGDDGKERDNYLKDAALQASVTQPGVYEFTKKKEGQYWEIVGAKFLRPLSGTGNGTPAQTPGITAQPQTARTPGQVDPNTLLQNRAITGQVAMKVAGEVLNKALEQGAFKGSQAGLIDVGGLSEAVNVLAEMLMTTAGKFIQPVVAEVKTDKKKEYTDSEGRTHVPVETEGA